MKLNLYSLAMYTLLLVHSINSLPPASPILFDEIEVDDRVFFRKINFLTPYMLTLKLTQDEEVMIQRVLNLYNVSHNTLVDLKCPDIAIGMAQQVALSSGEIVPYISLSPAWQKLPNNAKEFVLAHELAHLVLGHCQIKPGDHIANIYKKLGHDTVLGIAIGCFGWTIAGTILCCKDIKRLSQSLNEFAYKSSVIGLFAGTYAIAAMALKSSQSREKEADIMAVNVLGSAEGGIVLCNELLKKENIALVTCVNFMVDVFGFSSHPSYHARMQYLQQWQVEQGKQ